MSTLVIEGIGKKFRPVNPFNRYSRDITRKFCCLEREAQFWVVAENEGIAAFYNRAWLYYAGQTFLFIADFPFVVQTSAFQSLKCSAVVVSPMQFSEVHYKQCSSVQCNAVQCSAVQCNAVKSSPVQPYELQCSSAVVYCRSLWCITIQCSSSISSWAMLGCGLILRVGEASYGGFRERAHTALQWYG